MPTENVPILAPTADAEASAPPMPLSAISGLALLPCPFCGSSGEEVALSVHPNPPPNNGAAEWSVQCYVCHVESPFYDTRAEVVGAWNKRTFPPMPLSATPPVDVEALEKELRAKAWQSSGRRNHAGGLSRHTEHVCWRAAEEIKRLRVDLERLITAADRVCIRVSSENIDDLRNATALRASSVNPAVDDGVLREALRESTALLSAVRPSLRSPLQQRACADRVDANLVALSAALSKEQS